MSDLPTAARQVARCRRRRPDWAVRTTTNPHRCSIATTLPRWSRRPRRTRVSAAVTPVNSYNKHYEEGGPVLLLGVVHDHPASVFGVSHLLGRLSPGVLALELPPLSVALFRLYAEENPRPPRLGGEMSAAIAAAEDARVVGIDGPNRRYLRVVLAELRETDASRSVTGSVARDHSVGLF